MRSSCQTHTCSEKVQGHIFLGIKIINHIPSGQFYLSHVRTSPAVSHSQSTRRPTESPYRAFRNIQFAFDHLALADDDRQRRTVPFQQ